MTRRAVSMSLTDSPSARLLIQGVCKRIAASNVCLPLSVRATSCAAVMRIGLEYDEPLLLQIVDDPLHILAVGAEVASEPRDRLWAFRSDDGAEDLPSGAGQPEPRNQPIARRQDPAVEPEQVENEAGQGIAGRRSSGFLHLSPWNLIDIMMSI